MKLFRELLSKLGLATVVPAPTLQSQPALAPPMPESEAGGFFRLGEIYKQYTAWTYLYGHAGQRTALSEELKQQARRMQAPAEVIADIDRFEHAVLPLPWDRPWAAWSEADQQAWNTATPYSPHWRDWLTAQPHDRYFFYVLGRLATKGWAEVEPSLREGRETPESLAPTAKDLLGTFGMLLTDDFFTHTRMTLASTTLQLLKDLAALRQRVENSPADGGVTKEVIGQITAACGQLRDEGHAGRLTRH